MRAGIDARLLRKCIDDRAEAHQTTRLMHSGRKFMSDGIIPLRRKGEERSALAQVDIAAVGMLISGQATSLNAARAAVILADLHKQRDQLTTMLADLQGRASTGNAQIDEVNAELITVINRGLVNIDQFAEQARVHAEKAT